MGWFTDDYEYKPAKIPCRLGIYLTDGSVQHLLYNEDFVKVSGSSTFSADSTAKEIAQRNAYTIRTEGVRIGNTHYPITRIMKVVVRECLWKVVCDGE